MLRWGRHTAAIASTSCVVALLVVWISSQFCQHQLNADLHETITAYQLTGDPSQGRDIPDIQDPLAQLGKQLFFTKALGGDLDSACVSCHHPLLGGGDGLTMSIGVGATEPDLLGPGRVHASGAPNVPRNAPTTFNSALWDQVLFHDGRIESLDKGPGQNGSGPAGIRTPDIIPGYADPKAGGDLVTAQSRFPLVSPSEMRGYSVVAHRPAQTARDYLSARLGGYGLGEGELPDATWVDDFAAVFGTDKRVEELVTEQNIAAALGAYERSQVFVDTPWSAYVQGDNGAIGPAAKRGALIFFQQPDEGGAGCVNCHRGDYFTDEQFYTLAVPQVGPGKHDDPYVHSAELQADDYGRWYATFDEADRYAFRTPTLLNLAVTGPYGHDGAFATLEDVVRHHLNPATSVQQYDYSQLDPGVQTQNTAAFTDKALAKLEEDRQLGRTPLLDVELTDRQVDDLLAFLDTLTDPCVTDPACLAPWMPSVHEPDPDGLRLVARFHQP